MPCIGCSVLHGVNPNYKKKKKKFKSMRCVKSHTCIIQFYHADYNELKMSKLYLKTRWKEKGKP